MAVTAIYSDSEGWNKFKQFPSEDKAIKWLKKEGIDVDNPDPDDWWNPSPMLIVGNDHTVKKFDGFEY